METKTTIRYKGREIKTNDGIYLKRDIQNGVIQLPIGKQGWIVSHSNQVSANVYFPLRLTVERQSIKEALQLDKQTMESGHLEGIVLSLKAEDFATTYQYEAHHDITISKEKALTIPFMKESFDYEHESNFQKRNENGVFEPERYYYLEDMISVVEDEFSEWVDKHKKHRKVTKKDIEENSSYRSFDRVFTDQFNDQYYNKREELELAFAKTTNLFVDFTGGVTFIE